VPFASIKLASDMSAEARPAYQYMDTKSASFARYLRLRANRHDDFYQVAAGGVDLCNAPVPVRKKPA
jgi:peptidylprolyl isomerase